MAFSLFFFIVVSWLFIRLGFALEVNIKTKQKENNKYLVTKHLMFCMLVCTWWDLNNFKFDNARPTYKALNAQ
jgi:hypothetical protein